MPYDNDETFCFPPHVDYPVSLAIWHWGNGVPTPVSGDLKVRPEKQFDKLFGNV